MMVSVTAAALLRGWVTTGERDLRFVYVEDLPKIFNIEHTFSNRMVVELQGSAGDVVHVEHR